MLIDRIEIKFRAGKGGAGKVAYFRGRRGKSSGGNGGEIVLWKKAERVKEAVIEQVIEGYQLAVRDLVATSNGFAWCDDQRNNFLWEEGGNGPVKLDFDSQRLCVVGEGLIMVGLYRDRVHIFDVEAKKLLKTVELGAEVSCLASLDLKRVALGGRAGRLFVVNVA
ncbi:MAG: hypothetical protein GY861_28875, partial [bacterium]|nr:hypothetical protein [bacterium]